MGIVDYVIIAYGIIVKMKYMNGILRGQEHEKDDNISVCSGDRDSDKPFVYLTDTEIIRCYGNSSFGVGIGDSDYVFPPVSEESKELLIAFLKKHKVPEEDRKICDIKYHVYFYED